MVNRLLLALSLLAAAAFVGPVIGVFRPAASDAVERAPGRVGRAIADAGGRPAGRADAAPIVVSAAASLTDALQEIAAGWKKASGDTVTLNFGASNVLARQIVAGAPVDLFISADEAQLGLVEHAELLVPGSRVDLLGNELVIAVPADRPTPVTSPRGLALPAVRRIAVGDPAAVPAGVYARRFLEAQGLWASLQDKIVPTGTVRLALAAVDGGGDRDSHARASRAASTAATIRSGRIGRSLMRMPFNAFATALPMAGATGPSAASPIPFAPNGPSGWGVCTSSDSKVSGKSSIEGSM